jgi:cytochrome c-type biogenesis protein CcmH
VLVLLLLLRPFLWKSAGPNGSHKLMNAAIYRDQLLKLDQDVAEGTLGQEDFAQARTELQRRALDDTRQEDATSVLRAPKRTMLALAAVLPLATVGLYALLGNPAGLQGVTPTPAVTQQDVERMVANLAEKLDKEPGNAKGWVMLARSYRALGRPVDAEKAFERAGSFIDNDADALASYADIAAANASGNFAGKPAQLIEKALKVDPEHPMALWLAGTAAFRNNDSEGAIRIWGRLARLLPPESEDARALAGAIAEARGATGKADTAPAAGASVSGTVELDAALKAKAAPDDTVMVIARVPGTRMPVAVLKARANALPLKFALDDSLAMSPQAKISMASDVEIEARISKTGLAKAESGDLISSVQTVKVGAASVKLRVSQVRP